MIAGTTFDAPTRPSGPVRAAIGDCAGVLATAARLLGRHWPVLAVLYLAGDAAKELVLRAAVRASGEHAMAGFLVLVLAPMATLTAFILMLRTVRPSLPWLAAAPTGPAAGPGADAAADRTRRGLLDNLGSVLVPFLTVYVSYGYLRDDLSTYAYRVWEDETFNNPEFVTNPGSADVLARLPLSVGVMLALVAAVAVALRWLVNRFEGVRRRPWLGLPAAYVEVVAGVLTGVIVVEISQVGRAWTEGRRVFRWVYQSWYELSGAVGPLTEPLRDSVSWVWGVVADSSTAVVVVPIAWLLVGAVVYGHRVAPPPAPAAEIYRRAVDRWTSVPRPIHRAGARLRHLIADRGGTLLFAVRLLFRTGTGPVLVFCLAFVLAGSAATWLWELERLLVGPRDIDYVWVPFSGPLAVLNRTVEWVLLACLLAAAVDHVLRTQPAAAAEPPAVGQPSAGSRA